MQFDPKTAFKPSGYYVILEYGLLSDSSCRVIGITHSMDNALKYVTTSNRKVEGPFQLLDSANDYTLPKPRSTVEYPFIPHKKEFYPMPKPPNLFDTHEKAEKLTDFSMLTPPPSRVGSASTSPNTNTVLDPFKRSNQH